MAYEIAGIAAGPAMPALAAMAELDQTFALIEAHRVAERAFNAVCERSDSVVTGSPVTADERKAVLAASAAMEDAAIALCEYASPTLAGSQAKAEALLGGYLIEGSEIDAPMDALVRSIAQRVRA